MARLRVPFNTSLALGDAFAEQRTVLVVREVTTPLAYEPPVCLSSVPRVLEKRRLYLLQQSLVNRPGARLDSVSGPRDRVVIRHCVCCCGGTSPGL